MSTFPVLLQIIQVIDETNDCKSFVFSKPKGFEYKAGQYITIQIGDDVKVTRSYSLSSIPSDAFLMITIKKVENGLYSRWALEYLKVGAQVKVIGVFGTFTIGYNIGQRYEFFAAGSGIVPIYSLIQSLLQMKANCQITLHVSSPNESKTIFSKNIKELERNNSGLNVKYYYSQPKDGQPQRLNNFTVQDIFRKMPTDTQIYFCGPIDYMDVIRINALTFGISKDNIHYEDYLSYYEDGYEGEERSVPEDVSPHQVVLNIQDSQYTFDVQYPKSILESALENGLPLPYSCFSGQCGQCAAKLVTGQVHLAYNQTLTDQDLQEGYILTCQGYPINGDIEITYNQ